MKNKRSSLMYSGNLQLGYLKRLIGILGKEGDSEISKPSKPSKPNYSYGSIHKKLAEEVLVNPSYELVNLLKFVGGVWVEALSSKLNSQYSYKALVITRKDKAPRVFYSSSLDTELREITLRGY